MKKLIIGIMIILLALAMFSGLAAAQSGTYVPPPVPPPIGPEVPPNWVKINVLDKTVLFIDLCPTLGNITATIPDIYKPYELRWESQDPGIATVTAQSAAVVSPVSVGSTWVLCIITAADGITYYDAVLVHVAECAPPPGPTPPTAGGTTLIAGTLISLFLIFAALSLSRRRQQES